ncbi:MAG: hypothetical protein ACREJU_07325 [Nitrospiraceae bacterium]
MTARLGKWSRTISIAEGRQWIVAILICLLVPRLALGQETPLVVFPIRPFNFDVAFSQRTFAPDNRVIGIQAGLTALRFGQLEARTIYQFYSNHGGSFTTDQHSLYLNPRWNNFIDLLNFPKGKPINRMIRHVLFGPLEDRAVPYLGLLAGATLPGPGHDAPGHLVGGQVGVRFPVARGLSVDMALQYIQFGIDFRGEAGQTQQWLFTTGVRF